MDTERISALEAAKAEGRSPFVAVRMIRDSRLFEAGKEFNIAMDMRKVYGLTTRQLHDIVAWFKGFASDEELKDSLEPDE
ncbi:hypothetical protein KGA66_19440 [Actinocrinis puniceicyclus]|uniref:Uncharacterized protein n=1 Tax=Actinocrinis puniceicyclus TaxID=977794 RepID=A0A8J7WRP7_9ACTN|nr:hypothetical protein [Actinocrinis puniceicyclus]MBS2965232.1 hypothetical protein [Actinocrinis puniceicyclus]